MRFLSRSSRRTMWNPSHKLTPRRERWSISPDSLPSSISPDFPRVSLLKSRRISSSMILAWAILITMETKKSLSRKPTKRSPRTTAHQDLRLNWEDSLTKRWTPTRVVSLTLMSWLLTSESMLSLWLTPTRARWAVPVISTLARTPNTLTSEWMLYHTLDLK